MSQNKGVPALPSGHSRAEPEEVSALRASVPNAAELVEAIEAAEGPSDNLDEAINNYLNPPPPPSTEGDCLPPGFGEEKFIHLGYWGTPYTSSIDVALSLLDDGNDWRRVTPTSISVYAASPYSATAQVRYDGYGATIPLQVCAAVFKMRAAIEAKASAIEARRAATAQTGAVHESAVAKPGAPQEQPNADPSR